MLVLYISLFFTCFAQFSGRVQQAVSITAHPNEDAIVYQKEKGDLLLIQGDAGDFWEIAPDSDLKLYVYKPYVDGDSIITNGVSARIFPEASAHAAIILNKGDLVDVLEQLDEWVLIAAPPATKFYAKKAYVEKIANASYFFEQKKRRKRAFDTLARIKEQLDSTLSESAFIDITNQLKNILIVFDDIADVKRLATQTLYELDMLHLKNSIAKLENSITIGATKKDRAKLWLQKENELFERWKGTTGKTQRNFYDSQRKQAKTLQGHLLPYDHNINNMPGDYILYSQGKPVALVYSTLIDLKNLVDKNITCYVYPRYNNNYAFPAYFVLEAVPR